MEANARLPSIDDWVYRYENGRKKFGKIRQIIIDQTGTHVLVEWAIIDTYKTMHVFGEDVKPVEEYEKKKEVRRQI